MRGAPLVALLAACNVDAVYRCQRDGQCTRGSETGVCEPVGYCSFTDTTCMSGRRFDSSAGDGVGGKCVDLCSDAFGDEDGDGIGDACDPCPISPNNSDADGDGVGDDCDPRPADAGDTIAMFEGFHRGLPATWSAPFGATQTGDDVESSGALVLPVTSAPSETIYTRVTPTSAPGADAVRYVQIVDPRAASGAGVACALGAMFQGGTPTNSALVLDDDQSGTPAVIATTSLAFALGTSYQIALGRSASSFGCAATPTGATGATVSGSVAVTITPDRPAIDANLTARWSWVMVVTSP